MSEPSNIRLATADDAGVIQGIYAPHCETGYASFEDEAPPVAEMRSRIATGLEHYPWLVAERNGEVAGYAYASEYNPRSAYRWSCDTSVYVHESAGGRGYGKALYTRLLELLTAQGFINAYAGITLPNPASLRLHESAGFAQIVVYDKVGWKLGQWWDVAWWHRRLAEPLTPPSEPLQMSQLGQEWLL